MSKFTTEDCIDGTFEAMAWHGKHVSADPSGFNWRLVDDDIDVALSALRNIDSHVVFQSQPRVMVTMHNLQDRVVIHAKDTLFPEHAGCRAVLSVQGRDKFIRVLESVVGRANDE